ncbi:unnamed protein product, partial [Closterium sp. Yama58-4]
MLEMRKQNFDGSSSKEGFIQFSAYRITPSRMVAMGLMPLTHHDVITAQHCWWEAANGQWTDGAISVKFPGEHHARAYECVLLYCDLQRPVSSMVGGTLKMAVDQQDLVVFKESPGTPEPPPEVREDVRVFERNLTYCSAPMFGAIDTQRLLEWIEFHRSVHGVDYLRMYDAGAMDDDVMAALRPYLRAGIMDITDIKGPALYDTWSYAQVLMVNDCALRSRQLTRWVLFMDVDEYIHVVEPPHSLLVFLNSVPAIPWLSFGSLTFPLDICGKIQEAGWEPWAVEQLVFREPVPHCKEPTKYYSRDACLKWDGHRKYVVNPRAAQVLQIHRVYELNPAYDANAPPDATAAASAQAAAALLATSGREEGNSDDNGNSTGNSTSVGAHSGAASTGKLIPVDDVQGLLIGIQHSIRPPAILLLTKNHETSQNNSRPSPVLRRGKNASLVVCAAACDTQMSSGGGGESQSSSGTSGSQQATQQKQSAPNVAKLDMGGTGFPPRDDDGGGGGGGGGGGRF